MGIVSSGANAGGARPCGTSANALANWLANVWYPTMNINSTASASEKCRRSSAQHGSETAWSSRTTCSANVSAATSRGANSALSRYRARAASFDSGRPTRTPTACRMSTQ
jgi:hypothetical protein